MREYHLPQHGNLLNVNGELPTGIQNIKAATKTIENNVIYNLAGQKVNENYKGIVISSSTNNHK
ncbi:MAG: hypothetical protein J6M15_05110 [Prevotella sp.]|nr:hypothetical protein [Prevotella sp.]